MSYIMLLFVALFLCIFVLVCLNIDKFSARYIFFSKYFKLLFIVFTNFVYVEAILKKQITVY